MRLYNRLRIKGVPWFKDQEFDLSRKGISVILGKNLNTPAASTNAAGKSYFFSHLPEVILDETPGDNRKDRPRKGVAEVELSVGGHHFKVVKDFAKTSRSRIEKDGVDLGIKDVAERKAYLAKLVSRSSLEYQTLDFIDSTNIRNHPLVKGDTASRRKFFTEFFKLDDVDHFRKLIHDEIGDVNEAVAVLAELRKQLKELKSSESLDVEKAEAKLGKRKAELAATSKELEGLSDTLQFAAYVEANKKELKLCLERASLLEEGKAERALAKAKKVLSRLEAFDEYQQELKLWKLAVKKRKAFLADHPDLADYAEVKERLSVAERKLENAEVKNLEVERLCQKHKDKVEDAQDSIREAREELKRLQEGETECTKCGQPLTSKHRQKEEKALEAKLLELKTTFRGLKEQGLPDPVDTGPLKKSVKALRDQLEVWQSVPSVGEKPIEPDDIPEADAEEIQQKVKELEVLLDAFTQVSGNETFYQRFVRGERPKKVESLQAELLDKHSSLTKEIHELEFALVAHRDNEKKVKKLAERIAELKEQTADLDVLKTLEKAYVSGTGGIKNLAIKTICDKMTQRTNKYARLIFPEDYQFSFDLDTQFHILVTRTYKGDKITSDVRKLSGAESSMFSLLLLIVLLTFVPKAKRSSLLVLDEPNANFGQEMTEALIRFLPILNKVIPHIIVITPHSEHDYGETAKYFTVVKKGNSAKIVEGKV